MNKINSLRKQITICSRSIEEKKTQVETLKNQLMAVIAEKKIMPVVCIVIFFSGILHTVSPLFRRIISLGTKFAIGQTIKNQLALSTLYKFSKKIIH